jgi:hypothetical protein
MKTRALERKLFACVAALLVAAAPLIYSSCGTGVVSPLDNNSSQESSTPTVSSVVPNSGPPDGGTVVTVNGSNFTSGAQATAPTVSFGGTPATNITVISSSQLKVQVPAHAAGSVGVQVTTSGGLSASLAKAFTYVTATFSLKSVSPISGPSAGGNEVTISGSGFQSGVSVNFGGLGASSVSLTNSTTITAVAPVHSSGPVTVTVTNSNGDSATLPSGYTFHSIDLLWGAPSSSTVAISGYNVYRGDLSAGPFSRLNGSSPLSTTSYEDTTVYGGTTYYYEVKSVDSSGVESPPAGPVPATTTP